MNTYLPDNLKMLRRIFQISQREMADIFHIKRTTYQAYEDGRNQVPITLLTQISKFFAVPIPMLMEDRIGTTHVTEAKNDENENTWKVEYCNQDMQYETGYLPKSTMDALRLNNLGLTDFFNNRKGFFDDEVANDTSRINKSHDRWLGIPMYDIPVTAGAVNLIRDDKASEPAYYLHIPSFRDCTFGARVSGDSMYPEIRNGDYVVCKELQSMDSLIYGDIYLVVTKDGMETVKYVHPHEEREDWIKLVPYNKSVPATPMPKSNIFKVYKVKGVLKGY